MATSNCTHAAGVRCPVYDNVAPDDAVSHTNVAITTDTTLGNSECKKCSEAALKSTIETLGVLTGLLAAALVVVTVGWIVSCVYWQRRITQR